MAMLCDAIRKDSVSFLRLPQLPGAVKYTNYTSAEG